MASTDIKPDNENIEDLNDPLGILWPTIVEAHGIVPISTDSLTLLLRIDGKSMCQRYYPNPPSKLSEFITLTVQALSSPNPKWNVEEQIRCTNKAWYIFPDTLMDDSVEVKIEIRQRSKKISGLLGEKVIASACLPLSSMWKALFMNPNGVTELVELANPNVIAEYEPINVPQRTVGKSHVVIGLRYEKLKDMMSPRATIQRIPTGAIRYRVFSAPKYYKTSGACDHSLNIHSARVAAERWLNGANISATCCDPTNIPYLAVSNAIELINIETTSVTGDAAAFYDVVVVWFRKL